MIGIDLGGTNIRAALVLADGRIAASRRIATRMELGVPSLLDRIERMCRNLTTDCGLNSAAIGLGIPGILNQDGSVRVSPNLQELCGVNLPRLLAERLNCPVHAVNDADGVAWGEASFGAGRDLNSMLVVTLGTGVGGGLILNRSLWSGSRQGVSGEIGHITVEAEGRLCGCGNRGCLETYASATGIVRSVKDTLNHGSRTTSLAGLDEDSLTAVAIAKAARNGDAVAIEAFELAARKLGQALAGAINLFNPDGIIFCGGLSNSLPLLKSTIEHELTQRSFVYNWHKTLLLRGELGDDAGILGVADLAGRSLGFSSSAAHSQLLLSTNGAHRPGSRRPSMTTRQEDLEARELYRLITFNSPEEIFDEVSELLTARLNKDDFALLTRCYTTAVHLYRGEWPGYQPCNTEYHNLFHATHTFLALARFIHGSYLEDAGFSSRRATIALCVAVFHDSGYLQEVGDTGSGAKYTREHVQRGIDLFYSLASEWRISAEELVTVEKFFFATDIAIPYEDLTFPDEECRRLAHLLDAADLITQMSDRTYLEKLLFLFHEFREAGLSLYSDENEMLRKTVDFYAMIEKRLSTIDRIVDSRVRAHFLYRNNLAVNPYQESMRRQKNYLTQILELTETEPISHLKRNGIVDKIRQRHQT